MSAGGYVLDSGRIKPVGGRPRATELPCCIMLRKYNKLNATTCDGFYKYPHFMFVTYTHEQPQ